MLSRESSKDDFIKANITNIIERYRSAPEIYRCGTVIKKLSDSVLAKVGTGITKAEYINQLCAYELLNEGKLRVPEPYRFFEGQEDDEDEMISGFLLMEFLPGNTFDPTNEDDAVLAAKTIELIHQRSKVVDRVRPGPPSGVCATGFPWQFYEPEIPFQTVQDLEQCLNKRSKGRPWHLGNESKGWVLCHLDYTSRNLIRLSDGSGVGVLDWPTSAFYPAYFDLAALKFQSTAARNQDQKRFLRNVARELGSSVGKELNPVWMTAVDALLELREM
jgi:hypothetical protein